MNQRTRKQQRIVNLICVALMLAGMYFTCTDGVKRLTGSQAWQYLENFAFICVVMPACIGLSDIGERLHPEYYTDEELRRKGL